LLKDIKAIEELNYNLFSVDCSLKLGAKFKNKEKEIWLQKASLTLRLYERVKNGNIFQGGFKGKMKITDYELPSIVEGKVVGTPSYENQYFKWCRIGFEN
jgi:hypothetical protein